MSDELPMMAFVPACADAFCVVEAVDPAGPGDAVPFDRVEATGRDQVPLYVPPGREVGVRVYGLDGTVTQAYTTAPSR